MVDPLMLVFALLLLAGSLGVAVARPRGLPEAAGAVPAALLVLATGLLSPAAAGRDFVRLGPVVAFLAAVLALARLADLAGLFDAVGARMALASRGRPLRLLALVFAACSATTAVLSLDTTVVLLAPVVLVTARAVQLPARPHLYACVHLSNSASLLLPVSNLTNLLALPVSGLGFLRFGALMAGPWVAAIAVEGVVMRRYFRAELCSVGTPAAVARPLPRYALAVVVATLAGFVLVAPLGLSPWVPAAAGATALAVPLLRHRRVRPGQVLAYANLPFAAFVLGLGVVVDAVRVHGLDRLDRLIPQTAGLPDLLAVAAVAALLANLVNNLPAVLVLLPAVAGRPGLVLAVVIGANIGPNLTYAGSLATLLWRRVLQERQEPTSLATFTRLGLLSVPAGLLASTAALWLSLRLIGT